MLFKQILYLVIYVYWVIAYSYLFLTPSILLSNEYLIKLVKKLSQSLSTLMLIDGFQTEFYLANGQTNIKELINQNPELIDIVVCNHLSTFDFLILMTFLQNFGISTYNFVLKNTINYFPGFGLIMYANTDIKLTRNWEKDKDNLSKQIDNIKTSSGPNSKKQVIFIFPEGTRLTKQKLEEGQKFSRLNNIPVYDNLLVPKAKGLWFLINHLKKTKKLGRVWDITLTIPKFLGKSAYVSDVLGKPIGPIYVAMRELAELTKLNDLDCENLEIFKSCLFKTWKMKDDFIKNYKSYVYKKIVWDDLKYRHIALISLVGLIFSLCLCNKYGRYYLILSFVLSYILIIFKL
jgi:1-acyl-sn-glycerol-3-phosphate acyltransferase